MNIDFKFRGDKMDTIELLEPSEEYADDILKFKQEIMDSDDNDKFAGCGNLDSCLSIQDWIYDTKIMSNPDTCPIGRVPSNIYIAVRKTDNKIVGIIDLRHHIDTPILSTWGGHIGYTVRPSERNKRYATQMLKLNLLNAKKRGIDKLLIVCDINNIGSEKTILNNGGIFESTLVIDDAIVKRYWITI